ncbi:hypothetical protein CCR75_004993 [Bremia lactucae]|uniref:Uncharacterized protein n=1 Tax=Bremia lactucae TaxID=4779 RepID=A0A976IGG6_BRELC|nr:hypothetical protein CCR75_004993 [Bremia lactucae]
MSVGMIFMLHSDLEQVTEMVDFHPTFKFGMGKISDLIAFVGAGLSQSIACRSHLCDAIV